MTYPASTPASPPTNTNIAIMTLFMTVPPSPSCGASTGRYRLFVLRSLSPARRTSVREELRKETLDAVPEPDGAIARAAPRGLRRWLSGLTRFLQLLATVLCAFGHRRTDALGGLFDAFPNLATGDLLRSAFDLLHPGLHLRIIESPSALATGLCGRTPKRVFSSPEGGADDPAVAPAARIE